MKKYSGYLHKCQLVLVTVLAIWPVSPMLLGAAGEGLMVFSWMYPLALLLMACMGIRIPGKLRLPYGIVCSAAMVLGAVMLMDRGSNWYAIVLAAVYVGVLLWDLKIGGWSREQELPPHWIYAGIVLQLIARLLLHANSNTNQYDFTGMEPWITLAFLTFAVLGMFSMNRATLQFISSGPQKASFSMRYKNTLMILAVFALALVISQFQAIVDGVVYLIKGVVWLLGLLFSLFDKKIDGLYHEAEPTESKPLMEPPLEGGEASQLALFLEEVVMSLIWVVTLALAAVALFLAVRGIIRKIRKLLQSAGRYISSISLEYEDEITDTREMEDHATRAWGLRKKRTPSPDEPGLTPVQQIRRIYLRLQTGRKGWSEASTARENLPPEAAGIYERARYSDHPVTQQDAEVFRNKTKKL